ncbi:MAG: urea transporter [Bacteroidales bacterium]|nr:urea transporter [Bacteroidales bacterium]
MNKHINIHFTSLTDSITNSYSQVFFSKSKLFAFLIIIVTFFDFYAGLSGLIAVLTSNLAAFSIGFNRQNIRNGFYGFNSLLVALGLGMYYEFNAEFILVLLFASLFTLLVSVMLEGVIGKYGLPYLSIPFLFGIWLVLLAAREYTSLEISQRGVYTLNEMYALGGKSLVDLHEWLYSLPFPDIVVLYFRSLGAIFFQYHLFPGIIIAIGVLIYSRQAFLLSILGFASAWIFYLSIGADINALSYSYIGFNFILTAIAIGGFFVIPSKWSYLWVILLTPLTSFLITSTSGMFAASQLSIYSLPFNLVVLMFLYILKFRERHYRKPEAVTIQHFSPEMNFYTKDNYRRRFDENVSINLTLPFWGEWTVTQAHEGEHTHKKDYKHAWDFEITDEDGIYHSGSGLETEDFYCFNKPALAPADGWVDEILDGVEDNAIGEVNLDQNWGNTIVIKHTEKIYTKLSHLKKDSFKVEKGDFVKRGDVLALCGNSGRSPRPHLHFQVQADPYIGSPTIDYPFAFYIIREHKGIALESYSRPLKNDNVSNIEKNDSLQDAFHFVPGQKIQFRVIAGNMEDESVIRLCVKIDPYNNTYIHEESGNSKAWFRTEAGMMYFTHFEGDKKSFLYLLFLGLYRTVSGYYQELKVHDEFTLSMISSKAGMILQDFIAPFYTFLHATYELEYLKLEDELSGSKIEMQSVARVRSGKRVKKTFEFRFTIDKGNITRIHIKARNSNIEATWEEPDF